VPAAASVTVSICSASDMVTQVTRELLVRR
jgi:hypothetical protein